MNPLKFNINQRVMPKLYINIGALLDVPTGSIVIGAKGESIINGGLGQITGIIGAGNNFKSTIEHYMTLSAADRVFEATPTAIQTYDTEMNISIERLESLASSFNSIPSLPITSNDQPWEVTDKTLVTGNQWGENFNKYAENKAKAKELKCVAQPFIDPYTKKPLEIIVPTFVEIDSMSEFEAGSTMELLTNDLDTSDTNTFAMKQGLFKSKFLSTLPRITNSSNSYLIMTAHIGDKINMATGPALYNQPTKKLQHLKSSDNIKGVSGKFYFLLTSLWMAHTASLLKNNTTKHAEYPAGKDDQHTTDLNVVRLTQLRGKNGTSGYTIEIVVSQLEGVLPALTEFHFIKEHNRFGISGSNTHYNLDLLPSVSLSRTTVRSKLDNDPKLRRAVNITAELLQLQIYHPHLQDQDLFCTPKELYDDIVALGYDWDEILTTRGYWTINQYDHPVNYLSSIDLLKMRKGLYKPYFKMNKKD